MAKNLSALVCPNYAKNPPHLRHVSESLADITIRAGRSPQVRDEAYGVRALIISDAASSPRAGAGVAAQ